MKRDEKISIAILILILVASLLCGCAKTVGVVECEPDDEGVIGYAIIHHSDGDEHTPITDYYYSYGTIVAYCADGRTVIGTDIILVID